MRDTVRPACAALMLATLLLLNASGAAGGRTRQSARLHPTVGLAFSPDGALLATARGPTVHLWNAATGAMLRELRRGDTDVTAVSFSPDGTSFAAAGRRELRRWDPATGELLAEIHTSRDFASLAYAPDGHALATAGGTIAELRDPLTLEQRRITTIEGRIFDLGFALDGQSVALAGSRVHRWNLRDAEATLLAELPGASHGMAISPDGHTLAVRSTRIVSTGNDYEFTLRGFLSAMDARTGEVKRRVRVDGVFIGDSVSYAPDGLVLALVGPFGKGGFLTIQDAVTLAVLRRVRLKGPSPSCVRFSPTGETLALGYENGTTRIHDTGTGEVMQVLDPRR